MASTRSSRSNRRSTAIAAAARWPAAKRSSACKAAGARSRWATSWRPYDDIHPIFGNVPTLTTSILSTASLWAQGGLGKTAGGFDARLGNSVRYDSPKVGGFTGSVQISQYDTSGGYGTDAQQRSHAYVLGTGGFYNNGPLQVGLAYEANNNVRGLGLDDYGLSLAGAWNFGAFRLGGVWERLKYDVPSGDVHRDYFGISGTFNLGPGQIYAYVAQAQDGKGSACDINDVGCTRAAGAVGGVARGNNTSATEWELSYTYPLSKRTLTYVGYHQIDNDEQAGYNFNINPYAVVPGANASGFALGLVHFF